MATVLIIGANRGIGAELARLYAQEGWRVHATTRSGQSPELLKGLEAGVVMHRLDVRDGEQIRQIQTDLGDEPLDVAIMAAGTYDRVGGAFGDGPPIPEDEVFAINTEAPMNIAAAVFPNLTRAAIGAKLAFISSADGIRAGGRQLRLYGESKARLNDRIRAHAPEWAYHGVIGVALHPGWVRTEMGGAQGPVSPEESATGLRRVISQLTPADCGAFRDFRGQRLPW